MEINIRIPMLEVIENENNSSILYVTIELLYFLLLVYGITKIKKIVVAIIYSYVDFM